MTIRQIIVVLLTVLITCSCSKREKIDNPMLLKGSVLLSDEGTVFIDKSGMTVTVENSNPLIAATTNVEGEFTLSIPSNLKSFALVYSKPLYGSFKRYFEKRGDELYAFGEDLSTTYGQGDRQYGYQTSESLGYKSTVTVNSLATSVVSGKLRITCNISSPNVAGEKYIRFFYQKNQPNISFATVPKTSKNMGMPYRVQNGDNVIEMCMSCLYQCADMKSGETVYITAYGDSFYSNLYTDKATSNFMMPNVNLSNHVTPVSFVLP